MRHNNRGALQHNKSLADAPEVPRAHRVKLKTQTPRATVCGPNDIHLSWPEIIYDFTSGKDGGSGGMCWVVNPWFVRIQSDHETTDIPKCGSWSTIMSYHQGLKVPKTTPLGQSNLHGYPLRRFPPLIPLHHMSHISDGLVVLTRSDDPMLRKKLAVLLGPNNSASRKLVKKCRKTMIKAYRANIVIIRELKIELYGENSYY